MSYEHVRLSLCCTFENGFNIIALEASSCAELPSWEDDNSVGRRRVEQTFRLSVCDSLFKRWEVRLKEKR